MEADSNSSSGGQSPVPWDQSPISSQSGGEMPPARRGFINKVWRLLRWPLTIVITSVVGYLLLALGGAWIPENADFIPDRDGVEVYIFSGDVHSDIILPLVNDQKDWRENFPLDSFTSPRTDFTHVSIGWGSREFYLQTPTWNDLKLSTAAQVLFTPSKAVMHVELLCLQPVISSTLMKTRISATQYQSLIKFIEDSFADDANGRDSAAPLNPTPITNAGYRAEDHFYPANGSYHLFRTCNCWTGEAMRAGGIKVGRFTPLPRSVLWHLPP